MKKILTLMLLMFVLPVYAMEIVAIHNRADHPFDPLRIILWGVQATPEGDKKISFNWYEWNDSLGQYEDTLSTIGVGGVNWDMADTSRITIDSLPGYDIRWRYIFNGAILESLSDSSGN